MLRFVIIGDNKTNILLLRYFNPLTTSVH